MPETQVPTGRDRRRKGLYRVARLTWPARRAGDAFLADFPCNLLSHKWKEIPPSLRSYSARSTGKVEFVCSRCSTRAGFTN